MKTHVVEHRRVLGGDWVKVLTVGDDLLADVQEQIAGYNGMSGAGDWRIVASEPAEEPKSPQGAGVVEKPSLRDRLRWKWVMLTSKRGRR